MKMLPLYILLLFAEPLSADTVFKAVRGVSVTTYDPVKVYAKSEHDIIEEREPKDDKPRSFLYGYRLKWMVSVPEWRIRPTAREDAVLILKIWDPMGKCYPGWNPPIVEIFLGGKRVACQKLTEVGWAFDVWADTQKGLCLSVLTSERSRIAHSTNQYRLNSESMTFDYQGSFFSKEELQRENVEWRKRRAHDALQQDGADQPATAPESKAQGKQKPKPESEARPQ